MMMTMIVRAHKSLVRVEIGFGDGANISSGWRHYKLTLWLSLILFLLQTHTCIAVLCATTARRKLRQPIVVVGRRVCFPNITWIPQNISLLVESLADSCCSHTLSLLSEILLLTVLHSSSFCLQTNFPFEKCVSACAVLSSSNDQQLVFL